MMIFVFILGNIFLSLGYAALMESLKKDGRDINWMDVLIPRPRKISWIALLSIGFSILLYALMLYMWRDLETDEMHRNRDFWLLVVALFPIALHVIYLSNCFIGFRAGKSFSEIELHSGWLWKLPVVFVCILNFISMWR